MKQDQPDCDVRKTCKHISQAKQSSREQERVAHYTIELIVIVCVIIVMALAWRGAG